MLLPDLVPGSILFHVCGYIAHPTFPSHVNRDRRGLSQDGHRGRHAYDRLGSGGSEEDDRQSKQDNKKNN